MDDFEKELNDWDKQNQANAEHNTELKSSIMDEINANPNERRSRNNQAVMSVTNNCRSGRATNTIR